MNRYYIFDDELSAIKCNQECSIAFLNTAANRKYKEGNYDWSEIKQRETDGKYTVLVCPYLGTFGYNIETEEANWFTES